MAQGFLPRCRRKTIETRRAFSQISAILDPVSETGRSLRVSNPNLSDRQLVQGWASDLPRHYEHGRTDRDGGHDQCGIHSVSYLPQRDGNPPDLSRRATAIAALATHYFQSPATRFLGVLHEGNSL